MGEQQLGTLSMKKLFFKFTIPAVISMVLMGSQTMIDGIFLGNFVGANGLASMNIVQPYIQVIMAVGIIVGLGSISIMGRALGAGEYKRAQNTFKTSSLMILVISLLYGLGGMVLAPQIAEFLGAEGDLLVNVITYIRAFSLFLPMMPLMIMLGFTNRIIGNPSLYLKASIASLMVNILLDYLLIKVFALGMFGAALATGISYTVGMIMALIPLLSKDKTINVFAGEIDKTTIGPVLYNGSSEGVSSVATALTTYLFNIKLMALAGADGVAAFTVVNYLVNFGALLIFGIADGITPIISYNFGHGKLDRVKEVIKYGVKSAYVIGFFMFLLLVFQSETLISIIAGNNEKVIELAATGGMIYSVAFLINSINIIASVYFTALGNAKSSIVIAASRGIIFVVLGISVFPLLWGIVGVWFTVPFAELATILAVYTMVKINPLEKSYALEYGRSA